MSRNVDLLLELVAAVQRGDWDVFVRMIHPDGELYAQRSPVQGTYAGREGVERFIADTRETFDVFHPDYPEVHDLGDRVVAIGTIRVRGRGSQLETEIPSAALIRFDADGLITYFRDYVERSEAMAAAAAG